MKMNYEGRQRKELAASIAKVTGEKAVYMKAPTYAYRIGIFTIERDGDLVCGDEAALAELLRGLAEKGFTAKTEPQEANENADGSGLTVTVPVTAASIENLRNLLEAKGALIKKALGISNISIKIEDDKVSFHWFTKIPEPDEVKAYTEFIAAICRMSKEQKCISRTERSTDNEKFTFRVFLIRLGFIGDEYKNTRRILLRNLFGNSAWRNGAPKKEVGVDD
ncbi:MAG: virulence protein [Oscillospiraceae bacterium]|jgi:hypothetical protein|nr:virulence protein [Oscillospiraceae bacterium]